MPSSFYLILLSIVIIFMTVEAIYLFNTGRYFPYLAWNKEDSIKKRVFDIGSLIVVWVCIYNLSFDDEPPIFIIQLLMIALVLCVSILNYLSYTKIRDLKIIYQTVILDISVIAVYVLIFVIRLKSS